MSWALLREEVDTVRRVVHRKKKQDSKIASRYRTVIQWKRTYKIIFCGAIFFYARYSVFIYFTNSRRKYSINFYKCERENLFNFHLIILNLRLSHRKCCVKCVSLLFGLKPSEIMSAVDEIINYKRSPDEDFYAILNSNEHSSVSIDIFHYFFLNQLPTHKSCDVMLCIWLSKIILILN